LPATTIADWLLPALITQTKTIQVMQKKRLLHVITLSMKLTLTQVLLSAIFTFGAFAKEAKAQGVLDKLVTINAQNTEIKKVIAEIKRKTEIEFIYSSNVIQSERKISVTANEKKLGDILAEILNPLHIGYKLVNDQVLLFNLENKVTVQLEKAFTPITGIISNSKSGEPLAGATVSIKGKNKAVTTDSEGKFTINAEPGDVLVISSVGYLPYEVTVNAETNYAVKLTANDANMGNITVIGSRGKPRTDVNRPVPVDVISSKELENTGQTDLGQMAQFTSPSFNSAKNGINGVANFADPASLRGMSPDQSLVLVNGKRRHQFSAINNNVTVGKGTVVTDLNSIPSLAVERMEILRDGAAAQYGSDAIAGIMNLALKKNINSGTFKTQFGTTKEGDGGTALAALNYGFGLGKKGGYFNFTLHYQYVAGTNRTDPYTGIFYNSTKSIDDSIRNARAVWPTNKPAYVTKYGSNQTKAYQTFINMGLPIGKDWSLYSFGGFSKKDIKAYGFLRNARPGDANSNPAIFADGYIPELPGETLDFSLFAGVNKKSVNGWNIDLSTGYGINYLDLFANNTTNPSMGAASPTSFYVGRSTFGQSTTEAIFSKNYDGALGTKSVNLAFGTQLRIDNFKLAEGDSASYKAGPLAISNGKAPGSSGRPGIAPADKANESRTNIGVFVDIESDITEKFLVAIAGRFENYSDFGGNLSGKLATRLKLSENFALRASINRGFRAPSLQQVFNSQTTSTVQAGVIRQTKQLRSDDARLAQLGIQAPKAELSWNYNVGLTAKAGTQFLFTLDAYQIDVTDRIIISEQLAVSSAIPALLAAFPATTGIREVTFFTNHINTRTKGIDFVTSFKHNFTPKRGLNASLAFTVNKTEIISQKATPAQLQAGATSTVKLIDTVSISLIETSQPRNKILASIGYQGGKFNVTAKATYFGKVVAWEKPAGLPHRSQTYAGKTLVDLTAGYDFSKRFSITIGVNNIFDVYPDKTLSNYASYSSGQIPYTRNANQFGFNGSYYYTTLNLKF
jgi:iron complex outermembrane receptor protein